jgi:hypothetical protein
MEIKVNKFYKNETEFASDLDIFCGKNILISRCYKLEKSGFFEIL